MDFRCSFFIKNGPFVRCRETADTAPVSYTHLDVYKRQEYRRLSQLQDTPEAEIRKALPEDTIAAALAAKWTGTKSMMTPMPIRWQALTKEANWAGVPYRLVTVSYTHLPGPCTGPASLQACSSYP